MKINKKIVLSLAFLFVLAFSIKAQENITQLLSGTAQDANTLAKAYLEPFGKSFGTSLNNGWYNTAKPHKLGGFDLTFTVAVTMPPSSSKTFDVSKLSLNYWQLQTATNNMAPTVTGEKTAGPVLIPKGGLPGSLTLPKGAGLPFVPAPILQVGIGLPFHTELVGRYIPTTKIGDYGQVSLWGVGLKNEFKEFIPGMKLLPFNLSLLLGYTDFQSSFSINAPKPAGSTKKQELLFEATGFTGKILISKSIPILTVYAGVGFNKSTTNVSLLGDYNFSTSPVVTVPMTDPISLDFTNSGLNANIGLRIKLAVIALHFDYAVGKFAVYNAGIGINFR